MYTDYIKKIINPGSYARLFRYIRNHGLRHLGAMIRQGLTETTPQIIYERWFENHRLKDPKKQREYGFSRTPKISILVPAFNTDPVFLREMLDSVRNQTYGNWELCIADASTEEEPRQILQDYADRDPRIRITWLKKNEGISGNTNQALKLATGDYIGLLDHDDLVEPDLLYQVVLRLQDENTAIVYTDEDKYTRVERKGKISWVVTDPNFKPDFSPDLFLSHNYITHFYLVQADIARKTGGFHSAYDGAQDYDFMFRCMEILRQEHKKIRHVPRILYHWRMSENSTAEKPESKLYAYEAGRKAIADHLKREGYDATVEMTDMWGLYHTVFKPVGNPKISIIIPSKDHTADLDRAVRSIIEKSTWRNFEFIIVENNSELPETFAYYKKLERQYDFVKVIYWKGIFNYAAINNFGAKASDGDIFLLLNNDTELLNPDSLAEMAGLCSARRDVGAVGAKLLYADRTVQHAGIVLGFGGFAGHVFHGIGENDLGFMMRPMINCNYSAVTGACLMVRRDVYQEVGGLSEEFVVGLNDVDFCMKVRRAGYVNVYDAFARWFHYESKTRGYDEESPEKKKRLEGEIALFRKYWGQELAAGDPFYNPNFSIKAAPFTLLPDYPPPEQKD